MKLNAIETYKRIELLSDDDVEDLAKLAASEVKRRRHRGDLITEPDEIKALTKIGGSIWWENGIYSKGYSAAFILNQNFSRVISAIKNKSLFVYKKNVSNGSR